MPQITLYRGDYGPKDDKRRGQTYIKQAVGSGLIAKFSDGGSSELLGGRDLLGQVLAHVGYDLGEPEQLFSYRSPLLSFSDSLESALKFMNRDQEVLEKCEDYYEAAYFVWRLNVTLRDEIEPGRYAFKYRANPVHCLDIIRNRFNQEWQKTCAGGSWRGQAYVLGHLITTAHASLDKQEHYAEIIDVVKFVAAKEPEVTDCSRKLLENTLIRATRDREWLIYPMDPMPEGISYSGSLWLNENLSPFLFFKIQK